MTSRKPVDRKGAMMRGTYYQHHHNRHRETVSTSLFALTWLVLILCAAALTLLSLQLGW